jgi:hypothetical protein
MCQSEFETRAIGEDQAEAIALDKWAEPPGPRPILDAVPVNMELDDSPIPLLKEEDDEPPRRLARRSEQREERPERHRPRERVEHPPAPREGATHFPTVAFVVVVANDPDGRLEGPFQAEVSPAGIRLWRGRGRLLHVPHGSKAEFLGKTGVAVAIDGRRVELNVVRGDGKPEEIARAVVDFLTGATDAVRLARPRAMPLMLVALVPLVIPVLAFILGSSRLVGGLVWGAVALVLSGSCVFFALQRDWKPAVRFLTTFGTVAVAFFMFFVTLTSDIGSSRSAINIDGWTMDAPPGGGYRVPMPLTPTRITRSIPGFKGTGLQISQAQVMPQHAIFIAAHGDFDDSGLTAEQRVFLVQQCLMQVSGTHPVSDRETFEDGKRRHEWFGKGPNSASATLRIWTNNTRLYALMASCARKEDALAVDAFVNAIRFDPGLEKPIAAGAAPGNPRGLAAGPGPADRMPLQTVSGRNLFSE